MQQVTGNINNYSINVSEYKSTILYKVLTLQSNKCYKVPNVTTYQMLQSNKCKMVYKCSMNYFVMFDTM